MGRESTGVRPSPDHSSDAARAYLLSALDSPQSIAPLPKVCAEIAQLTANDSLDAVQFARIMQSDAALVGEVMRVANSPSMRPRSPIVSLQQAISWLGIAEIRNISMAVMLHGEVFVAPGHEPQTEELWRESWLAGLWAKELARKRRKHVESAFLAALMHRVGAALGLKLLSRWELEQRTALDARSFNEILAEFEPRLGRVLMEGWHISPEVRQAAADWRSFRESSEGDLAATVHAAHLLAGHTLHPLLLTEEIVVESAVFEQLGVFPEDRRGLLEKITRIKALAGV